MCYNFKLERGVKGMLRYTKMIILLAVTVLALTGCGLRTVDQLYCLPKRSEADHNLQAVIDEAMDELSFCAPTYGDNRQTVQAADLDGDEVDEYLVFATDNSDKPLKILIFCQLASGYVLMDTIEGYGFAFDFVEYAQLDDRPGVEIIVGRQVSEQVARSVSVYRFSSGFSRQLLSTGYSRLDTCDLNGDGINEIFLMNYGAAENGNGVVTLFSYREGEMHRSAEQVLSMSASHFERFTVGGLANGRRAMFVTCEKDDKSLITDVYVIEDQELVTVKKGISTQLLQGYPVFPSDVDGDGITELAQLLPITGKGETRYHHLLQWYSLDEDGKEIEKRCTFHHYAEGWYLAVDKDAAAKIAVKQTANETVFYHQYAGSYTQLLSIQALTGTDREEQAKQPGLTILHKGSAVIYVAELTEYAQDLGITEELLILQFHPIRAELMTEED